MRNPADIRSVQENFSLGYIIKTRNQADQRAFSASGTADNCRSLSGIGGKADVGEGLFLRVRIGEGYIAEFDLSRGTIGFHTVRGVVDARFYFQHRADSLAGDNGSWNHNKHHGNKEEGNNNLHGVLHECQHIPYQQILGVDQLGADPYDEDAGKIHHQHESGHEKGHSPVDKDVDLLQLQIRFIKTIFLIRLHGKSADHQKA